MVAFVHQSCCCLHDGGTDHPTSCVPVSLIGSQKLFQRLAPRHGPKTARGHFLASIVDQSEHKFRVHIFLICSICISFRVQVRHGNAVVA